MKKKLLFIGGLFMLLGLSGTSSTFDADNLLSSPCTYKGELYMDGATFTQVENGHLIRYTCKNGTFICTDMGSAEAN